MLRRHRILSSRRGFTLTEVVVAIAVSSLVLLAAGLALDDGITSQRDVYARDAAQSDVRLASTWIQRRLPAAALPLRQAEDDRIEFVAAVGDGGPIHFMVGADCTDEPALIGARSEDALAAAYPPSAPTAVPAGAKLMTLRSCDPEDFRIEYRRADGSLVSGPARLAETRSVRILVTPTKGGSTTLDYAVGLDVAGQELTGIPNGDFALEGAAGAPFAAWTAAGTVSAPEPGGDRLAALEADGSGAATLTSDPFAAAGDDLRVAVRPLGAALCSVELLDEDGQVAFRLEPSLSTGEETVVPVGMADQAGQTRSLRLSASGGTCQFDDVRTGG